MKNICASCETEGSVFETEEVKNIEWGVPPWTPRIMVSVKVPVLTCTACGIMYTDWRAEDIIDTACEALSEQHGLREKRLAASSLVGVGICRANGRFGCGDSWHSTGAAGAPVCRNPNHHALKGVAP